MSVVHDPRRDHGAARVNVLDGHAVLPTLVHDKAVVAVSIRNVFMDSNENLLNTDCEVYLPAGPFNAVCSRLSPSSNQAQPNPNATSDSAGLEEFPSRRVDD